MTTTELMRNLKDYLTKAVADYETRQKGGHIPIVVYEGFPPIRTSAEEKASFIYCLVLSWEDTAQVTMSKANVEIGFSIYDEDPQDGWRSLFNIMEHVRQALLKRHIVAQRNMLVMPIKGELIDTQPYPQWQGKITTAYTIGQPAEEGIEFDGYQETKVY